MEKRIKYSPVGSNPESITLTPPLVPEVTEFSEKTGFEAWLPARCAARLIKDNPSIFSEVPFVLPDPFSVEDIAEISDLDELFDIGSKRFGVELDMSIGLAKMRDELMVAQAKANEEEEAPKKTRKKATE